LLAADHDRLGRILADDFLIIDVLSGQVARREELLGAISSGQLRFTEVTRYAEDRSVRLRDSAAVVAGRTQMVLRYQAAADALIAITGKLAQFRGESRFTTWAYKFVIFEVSAKIGRHFWRHPGVRLDVGTGIGCRAGFGFDPAQEAEWRDLLAALRRAVNEELTARRRTVFIAIVLNGVPLDALVIELAFQPQCDLQDIVRCPA
jgi:RNA polymerase sigma-70 factor (ECF subfamily)